MAEDAATQDAVQEICHRMQDDSDALMRAAEEIVILHDLDEVLTPSEMNVLRLSGLIERIEVRRERGRAESVRNNMRKAGSHQEYSEAEAKLEAAIAEDQEKSPALKAKIEELKRELERIQEARAAAKRRLDGYRNARENLRQPKLLPRFIQQELAQHRQFLAKGADKEINKARNRLNLINAVLEHLNTSKHAISLARRLGQKAGRWDPKLKRQIVDPAQWSAIQTELRAEKPGVEARLAELIEERDHIEAEIHPLLNYYVNQL